MIDNTGTAPKTFTGRAFGKYQLVAELGRGGMGVVYRAWDTALKRTVALKMLVAGDTASAEEEERLYKEATANARLAHPNILPVYEVGRLEGRLYFTMEFIRGAGFDKLMQEATIDRRRGIEILRDVARALDHAHAKGIIHRDVKPTNIMITGDGHVFLMDFGLARTFRETGKLTQTGFVMGTPNYMSPEQCRGERENLDGRSDIFGLGVVMYEFFTGKTPFDHESVLDVLMAVLKAEIVPPGMMQPDLENDLDTICMKALRKERDQRYNTAGEMADDLDRWLKGESVQARPETGIEKITRKIRLHRKPIAGIAVAVMAVAISAAWGVMSWRQGQEADRRREQAEAAQQARDRALKHHGAAADEIKIAEKCLMESMKADLILHLDAAVTELDKALKEDASCVEAWVSRARARNLQGRREQALADAAEALKRDAGVVEARYERAKVRMAMLSDLATGVGARGESQRKAFAENALLLKEDLDAVLAAKPDRPGTLLHCQAARALIDGRLEEAATSITEALKGNPFLDDALDLRGFVRLQQGKLDLAHADFAAAVKINPLNANAFNHAGLALAALGRAEEAVACYAAAIEVAPDFLPARVNLGVAWHDAGEWEKARAELDRVLTADPEHQSALEMRGIVRVAQGQADTAIADLDRALSREPGSVRALIARASAYRLKLDGKSAGRDAQQALALDAKSIDARIEHALALELLGEKAQALAEYGKVIEAEGGNLEARVNRGALLLAEDRKDEARADFEAFLENAAADHPRRGEIEKAVDQLRR